MHVVAALLTLALLARGRYLVAVQRLWHTVALAVTSDSLSGFKILCSCSKSCANQVQLDSLYTHLVLNLSTIAALYSNLLRVEMDIYQQQLLWKPCLGGIEH